MMVSNTSMSMIDHHPIIMMWPDVHAGAACALATRHDEQQMNNMDSKYSGFGRDGGTREHSGTDNALSERADEGDGGGVSSRRESQESKGQEQAAGTANRYEDACSVCFHG